LYNFFRQGDNFFMVLEYVNGTPLDKLIESYGLMTCEQAIPLFCQMLEGIDHAHEYGIVHRDIKPANMMLTQNGLLKVLDFGIARALGSARMTRAGNLIGTIEYMSPEQVRGVDTDARSDIYSLGMVLYEMLTGRVPFASNSEFELMKAQVEQLPTPPREFAPNIPEEVEWAILCATEKDPAKRFQTAGAFGDAIVDSVNTAIAAGSLSQIDMRRPTSRLSAAVVGDERLSSRLSGGSSPGFPQSSPAISSETEKPSAVTERIQPPPTRFAPSSNETQSSDSPSPKATRLGSVSEFGAGNMVTPEVAEIRPHQSSFFGNLTRTHYVVAGTVLAVFLLGVVGIAMVLLLRSGASKASSSAPAPPGPPPIEQSSPTYSQENPVVATEAQPGPARVADQSPTSNQSAPEIQSVEPPLGQPGQTTTGNKTARPNGAARNKPRRSVKDQLEAP
jgi:serine/threonine protein kinase